jgi:hypothetical protein
MLLTGMTFDNKRIPINITDCPVRINRSTLILANRPGSELIQNSTVRRSLNIDSAYEEYSYVFDKDFKFIGFLLFKEKFIIYNPNTKLFTELKDDMKFIPNTNIRIINQLSKVADQIKFKFNNEEYLFKHILGRTDKGILIYTRKSPKLLNIADESEVIIL